MKVTKKDYPTQEELKEVFEYSTELGQLTRDGYISGSVSMSSGGYRLIRFKGESYVASRLVWIFHNGCIADNLTVDHIEEQPKGVSRLSFNSKDVNHIENLQLLTKAEQQRKSFKTGSRSRNLSPGIRERNGRFTVSIAVDGKQKTLGTYGSKDEAFLKRMSAELEFWGKVHTRII